MFPLHFWVSRHCQTRIVPRGEATGYKSRVTLTEMAVPLVPQDLSAAETYRQISASLLALQSTSDGIFNRMRLAIIQRAGVHHIERIKHPNTDVCSTPS